MFGLKLLGLKSAANESSGRRDRHVAMYTMRTTRRCTVLTECITMFSGLSLRMIHVSRCARTVLSFENDSSFAFRQNVFRLLLFFRIFKFIHF